MSADLIGSTALKSRDDTEAAWVSSFNAFYQQFSELVFRKDSTRELKLWKTLGDEMIYFVKLRSSKDAQIHVENFRAAVQRFNAAWRNKSVRLQIKASAWTAGFPVVNAEIHIAASNTTDYIGPCMDIGFRLGKLSDPRRLAVSVELACLLLLRTNALRTYFDGWAELKGVLGGKVYPQIWIDMLESSDLKGAEKLRGDPPDRNELLTFCKSYIDELGGKLIFPFIEGDSEIGEMPSDWSQRYLVAQQEQTQETIPLSDEHIEGEGNKRDETSKKELSNLLKNLRSSMENPKRKAKKRKRNSRGQPLK